MDLSLIETLRWEPGAGFVRLERHLARLARSAAALGLPGADGAREALLAALPSSEGKTIAYGTIREPPAPSPRRGEGRGSGMRGGRRQNAAGLPPHPALRATFSPAGRRGSGDGACTGDTPGAGPAPLRIRLELFTDGRIDVQTAPFTPIPTGATWRVKIAATRLSSNDPLLCHKTSRRAAYAAARAEFPAAEADEVLLLNERGEICEGTITSLFLDDGSGTLKTPPLSCGLLAGVLREELLQEGRAEERVLYPQDLAGRPFFLGNSLRGLIPAILL